MDRNPGQFGLFSWHDSWTFFPGRWRLMACYPGQELLRAWLANHLCSQQHEELLKQPRNLSTCAVWMRPGTFQQTSRMMYSTKLPTLRVTIRCSRVKKKNSRVPRVRWVLNRTKSYILLFKTKLRPTHYRYWYEHRVKPSLTYNKHKTNQHQSIRKYQCSRFY